MEKILLLISSIFEKISIKKVLTFGLFIIFLLSGWIGYLYAPTAINESAMLIGSKELKELTKESKQSADAFMKKHKSSALYMTVLRFEFSKNTRMPIYRNFNNADIEKLIMDRLNGGDGALPIFVKGDHSNNDQMISIMQSEYRCDPFSGGGLARVWPDLVPRFTISCRVPIPPAFNSGTRGYIVVHFNKELTQYEMDAIRIDLLLLAKTIHGQ